MCVYEQRADPSQLFRQRQYQPDVALLLCQDVWYYGLLRRDVESIRTDDVAIKRKTEEPVIREIIPSLSLWTHRWYSNEAVKCTKSSFAFPFVSPVAHHHRAHYKLPHQCRVNSRDRDVCNRKLSFGRPVKTDNESTVGSWFSLLLGSLGAISRVKEFTTAPPEGVSVYRDGTHSARYF